MGKKDKLKYYGEENVNFVVSLINEGLSATKAAQMMCDKYGLKCDSDVERVYRKKLQKLRGETKENPNSKVEETEEFKRAKERVHDSNKKRFIVSWAQSSTSIHDDFLTNIEAYAEHIEADIHIIAGRYKNPTSLESSNKLKAEEKNKRLWHSRLQPYLDANRQKLHPYLQILSDVKVQVTAITPLTGFNNITGLESCIIGHPTLHLTSLPILDSYPNKLLLTTGAVTLPNYTDTKAGKKSEHHHALGFVVVELDGDVFHVRQVQCDDNGDFYDLWYKVSGGEVSIPNEQYPCTIWGDLHYGQHNVENLETAKHLSKKLNSGKVILHDLFDGKSINPHEEHDPFVLMQKENSGEGDLFAELTKVLSFVKDLTADFEVISVASNHNDFLDRFVRNVDWRKVNNKTAYLIMANIVASGAAPKGLVNFYLADIDKVIGLAYGDSYRLLDWELGLHYDKGANGSRGSANQFKNLMTKSIGGHSHSANRSLGSLTVGTLTKMRLGYNTGLSSWTAGVIQVYPSGKASHIHFIKGRYTTL